MDGRTDGRKDCTFGSTGRADVVHGGHNDVKVEALLRVARVGRGQDALTMPGVTPATNNQHSMSTSATGNQQSTLHVNALLQDIVMH